MYLTGKEIVRVRKRGDRFERMMAISDAQLVIINSNEGGVLQDEPLFRVLQRRADAPSLAKFFNRSMTETEYHALELRYREDLLKEKVGQAQKEKKGGIPPETPAVPNAEAEAAPPAEKKSLAMADSREKALSRVVSVLSSKGWTNQQIVSGLAVCRDLNLPDRKLAALARCGVEPEYAEPFLKAHANMRTVGYSAANTHNLFPFRVLVFVFDILERDEEKFEEFVEFASEHPELAEAIHDQLQLGNRGRTRDLMEAIRRMTHLFEITHGWSRDIRDIDYLGELGMEMQDDGSEKVEASVHKDPIPEAGDKQNLQEYLERIGVECCDAEQRLAPDQGNFSHTQRRRRGGF